MTENAPGHTLYREVIERREYELCVTPDGKLMEEWDTAAFAGEKKLATIDCSCGESFRKDETALEHIEEARAEYREEVTN